MPDIALLGGSVVLKAGLASCTCCDDGTNPKCELTDELNCDILLNVFFRYRNFLGYDRYYNNIVFNHLGTVEDRGSDSNPPPPITGLNKGWKPHRGCLRFLERCVKVSDEGEIDLKAQKTYCGPSTNGKDLWTQVCKPEFGDETSTGVYLYVIQFFGWRINPNNNGNTPRPQYWQPDDAFYAISKFLIEEN